MNLQINFLKLILYIFVYFVVGPGYKTNLTAYFVNDTVTWYTANEVCKEEVTSSHFNTFGGAHCTVGLAYTLSKMNL